MLDSDVRAHVHRTIKNMLDFLVKLKILKSGRISRFRESDESVERFDIVLEVVPMFVTRAFDYTIAIDKNGVIEGENNV